MLAMGFLEIIPWPTAFSGFTNTATLMLIGMMIIGGSFFTTGLATKLGDLLYKFVGVGEKWFVVGVLTVGCLLCLFLNGALVFALMAPIIDSITSQSGGRLTRKQAYMPLGIAGAIGNNLTTISASSMVAASGLFAASENGRQFSLFEPTAMTAPAVIAVIVFYALIGYKLQKKWYDFEEIAPAEVKKSEGTMQQTPTWRMWFTVAVTVLVVIGLIKGMNMASVSLLGAATLILFGCISEGQAWKNVSWSTIIIVAASIGFSSGLDKSGAAAVIANFIIDSAGSVGQSYFGMCVVVMVIGTIITQFMSDNACVAILVPITLIIAKQMGVDPAPMIIAAASGIKVGIATPICVVPMTQAAAAGYRFKDYIRIGGLVTIISNVVFAAMLYLVYF
jgi:di/tricarboxylate transporter